MKNFLLLCFALLLSACETKITSLDGVYENQENVSLGHMTLTFKPNGTVTVNTSSKYSKSIENEEHQYIISDNKIQIQNFAIPLTMYKDGSLDGYMWGVFKKK